MSRIQKYHNKIATAESVRRLSEGLRLAETNFQTVVDASNLCLVVEGKTAGSFRMSIVDILPIFERRITELEKQLAEA